MDQQQNLGIEQKRQLINEEFRRRSGQTPSSAGIGAPAANTPSPENPLSTGMMTNPQMPSGGAGGSPTDGTMAAVKQQKGEAQKLTEAMIWRQKKLTERGE